MINYFFHDSAMQMAAKNNLLSPYIEKWALQFHEDRVKYHYARNKLKGMIHFGNWLRKKRIPLEKIRYSHVKAFLSELSCLPDDQKVCFGDQRCAARIIVADIQKEYPTTDKILIEVNKYIEHLRSNRGLRESTCLGYQRPLVEFLSNFFKKKKTIAISTLTPTMIRP